MFPLWGDKPQNCSLTELNIAVCASRSAGSDKCFHSIQNSNYLQPWISKNFNFYQLML